MIALGAHHSYADVPLGEWLRAWSGLERNHYDRLGHVVQGPERSRTDTSFGGRDAG
jgi:putative membrane protein